MAVFPAGLSGANVLEECVHICRGNWVDWTEEPHSGGGSTDDLGGGQPRGVQLPDSGVAS